MAGGGKGGKGGSAGHASNAALQDDEDTMARRRTFSSWRKKKLAEKGQMLAYANSPAPKK